MTMRQSFHPKVTIAVLLSLALLLIVLFAARPAGGQYPALARAETDKGRRLAETLCVTCHLVGPHGPPSVVVGVPSFEAIANHTGQTPERLAGALIIPHPPMPAISLTNAEMRDIIAYILTLRIAK